MNGSTREVANWQAGRTGRAAPQPPACAPKTARCTICEKAQPRQVECQNVAGIKLFFRRLELHDREKSVRPGAVLCKDCCISPASGHSCPWWDLCWNI